MSARVIHADCRDAMREMPECSVDAIVTDPPYGLSREPDMAEVLRHWLAGDAYVHTGKGFMGKSWDSFVPGPSVWREAIRVLKPGGFCLSFFGDRTYDMGVTAMRLAGFEVRGLNIWMFSQGFPKSLDVGKALERSRQDNKRWLAVGVWLASERKKIGLSAKELCARIGAHGEVNHGGAVSNWETGINCPTIDQWFAMKAVVGFGDDMDDEVVTLNGRKGTLGENFLARSVTGQYASGLAVGIAGIGGSGEGASRFDIPTTDLARQWDGWGTAQKPSLEPIVLARKPLSEPTVAANVARWGCGALNIAACRVAGAAEGPHSTPTSSVDGHRGSMAGAMERVDYDGSKGRWPPNLLLDGSQGVLDLFPETKSGARKAGSHQPLGMYANAIGETGRRPAGMERDMPALAGDSGSAARFYPSFPPDDALARYCGKATKAERVSRCTGCGWRTMGKTPGACPDCGATGDGTWTGHPTVKPVKLMSWLCRLVTPPLGLIVDPFAGTGTTLVAARAEGFDAIGIEQDADSVADARHRLGPDLMAAE